LKKVKEWVKRESNRIKLPELWKSLCSKLGGHNQYYGVSHNIDQINLFFHEASEIFFKWINRRSQRKSMSWKWFKRYKERNPLPQPVICHKLF
jgi:hypothetical protein